MVEVLIWNIFKLDRFLSNFEKLEFGVPWGDMERNVALYWSLAKRALKTIRFTFGMENYDLRKK